MLYHQFCEYTDQQKKNIPREPTPKYLRPLMTLNKLVDGITGPQNLVLSLTYYELTCVLAAIRFQLFHVSMKSTQSERLIDTENSNIKPIN